MSKRLFSWQVGNEAGADQHASDESSSDRHQGQFPLIDFTSRTLVPPSDGTAIARADTLARAAAMLLRMALARSRALPAKMFGEPGWRILLVLAAFPGEVAPFSSITFEARLASATTARWLRELIDQGLVEHTDHPDRNDQRCSYYRSTEHGKRQLEAAIVAMIEAMQRPR